MKTLTRRNLLKGSAAGASLFMLPMINRGRYQLFAASHKEYSARAVELVERSLVIDMLSLVHRLDALFPTSPRDNVLLISDEQMAKIQSSGMDVFHPAVGMGGPDVKAQALSFVGGFNAVVAQYPDAFVRVDSASDFDRVVSGGMQGIIIGIQNSEHFENVDDVDAFHHLGQRVSQLTYNSRNLIGTGSTDRVDGGLSDFGVSVVERMNEVGMAVDTSHCGDQTTLDAFELSKKPVLITHSNCRALTPGHPRCKSDEAIKKMADTGGVMGITGVRNFVRDKEPTTIEHLLDHYDHVIKLAGIEHVGIGSDMDPDGYDDMKPEYGEALRSGYKGSYAFREKLDTDDFDHPRRVFDLTDGLIRRGYSDDDIELILGGNFRRVLGEIWG